MVCHFTHSSNDNNQHVVATKTYCGLYDRQALAASLSFKLIFTLETSVCIF